MGQAGHLLRGTGRGRALSGSGARCRRTGVRVGNLERMLHSQLAFKTLGRRPGTGALDAWVPVTNDCRGGEDGN
jgi:hypothetical protein